MLKDFSHFFACLLLVLLPLQSFAAANMAACNSLMQAEKIAEQVQNMPCHQNMTNTHSADKAKHKDKSSENHNNTCKATCATLCASLCAMTTIPSNIMPAAMLAASPVLGLSNQTYASITLPNLQRPPIFLA
jgi:hypothetical protein